MVGPLAGCTAVVTGGSGGIGSATAMALGEMGADIVVTFNGDEAASRNAVARLHGLGVRAEAFRADQSDADQVARFGADVQGGCRGDQVPGLARRELRYGQRGHG